MGHSAQIADLHVRRRVHKHLVCMQRYWFDTALPSPEKPIEAPGNPSGYILSVELGYRTCGYLHEQNVRCNVPGAAQWKRLHAIRRLG